MKALKSKYSSSELSPEILTFEILMNIKKYQVEINELCVELNINTQQATSNSYIKELVKKVKNKKQERVECN